ncbi:hypothetical protein PEC18_37640 [Paucibacter sp. O1-1]|nr:hypothetical protein [Paucibacter sp. O1-1]MDA3831361.1 hypothetical protein [Paucibacter sp. O1-1]
MAQVISTDEPPELISGRVRPFVGSTPRFTPTETSACNAMNSSEMPKAAASPDVVQASLHGAGANHETTAAQPGEQAEHEYDAEQAQLFGDHGQDEIGMRFGQVEQLLYRSAQAHPKPFAATDGDQRLGQLEAVIERISPGIRNEVRRLTR